MCRKLALLGIAVAVVLAVPSISMAYFPPVSTTNPQTPPDPFQVPGLGGLGEPESPTPDKNPTVATPEPATIVSALAGLAMLAGYRWRKQMKAA